MSYNLHCEGLDLLQTPSYITELCLSYDKDGNPDGGMEGVRKRYILWLRYLHQKQYNGEVNRPEQQHEISRYFNELIAEVQAVSNPQFYGF